MKFPFTVLCLVIFYSASSQHTWQARMVDEHKNPLPGASVTWKEASRSFLADSTGSILITGIPDGTQTFSITYVGHISNTLVLTFPLVSTEPFTIVMSREVENEEEEVIVTATRTSRTIANAPTRIEVISGEELTEKGNMKPGEIRMLLSESTGIQTQQTSATSYNTSIRIQGLDGRYTQLLRDGYPLYAGFSGGLSIMQLAPLDLRQVEVIKGSASTLYGGGAIAGLVNLVSKTPGPERELKFIANITSALGLDLSGFYGERFDKTGLTLFASRNTGRAYDPAHIGFTAIPQFERYTINPRLFIYGRKTTIDAGVNYITEDRTGGSMQYIRHGGTGYFERNNTDRVTSQLGIAHKTGIQSTLQFKNSYSRLNRAINIPSYSFHAVQQSSFSELTWQRNNEHADWVFGVNLLTDDLSEKSKTADSPRDYHVNTFGTFLQNTWEIVQKFTLETGLRLDYVDEFGAEVLPRFSAMWRISPQITTRIGGGAGYKTPSVFNEESERIQFQHLLPIDESITRNERSAGANADIHYTTKLGEVGVSLNHLFFYTRLNRPLVLTGAAGGRVQFINANGHIDTKGMETNLRLLYKDFKFFMGYTYTDANTHYNAIRSWLPLTAQHRLNNVLMYEVEEKLKIGLEAYYFSPQQLNDGSKGKSYWIAGLMAEKIWEHFSIFINFENFTNTRQTRFDTIYTGTQENPVFRDIYAPVDGFVVNGGIKWRL